MVSYGLLHPSLFHRLHGDSRTFCVIDNLRPVTGAIEHIRPWGIGDVSEVLLLSLR